MKKKEVDIDRTAQGVSRGQDEDEVDLDTIPYWEGSQLDLTLRLFYYMEVLNTIFDYQIPGTVLWHYSIQSVQKGHIGADDQMSVFVGQYNSIRIAQVQDSNHTEARQ